MIDLWLGDIFLLLLIPWHLIYLSLRLRPCVLPGLGLQFPEREVLDASYRKRYLVKILFSRIIPAILALYFVVRLFLWNPGVNAEGPNLTLFLSAGLVIFCVSAVSVATHRIFYEKAFIERNPLFQDSFLPIRPRVIMVILPIISISILVGGILQHDDLAKCLWVVVGLAGVIVGGKLSRRQLTHSRHELPWDGPLGESVAGVFEKFGLRPKKLILLPSLIANAFALPDGSVLVTSALRTIATPEEVAAVIAHELSHIRDKEGKKFQRLKIVTALPYGILAGVGAGIGQGKSLEAFVPPVVCFGAMTLSVLSAAFVGSRCRPMEFKCDADAAQIGLGNNLASCLDKLTRFMGLPSQWIGIDRILLTHPSLQDRVERLRSINDTASTFADPELTIDAVGH